MEKNRNRHAATLAQLSDAELSEAVRWFQTLPMSLELNGVRVIHACWDPGSIAVVENAAAEHGGFSTSFMQAAMDRSSRLFDAVEIMLKGRELSLPDGVVFKDKDGHRRSHVRVRWFESPQNMTYREYALPAAEETPDTAVPESAAKTLHPYDPADCPVFSAITGSGRNVRSGWPGTSPASTTASPEADPCAVTGGTAKPNCWMRNSSGRGPGHPRDGSPQWQTTSAAAAPHQSLRNQGTRSLLPAID